MLAPDLEGELDRIQKAKFYWMFISFVSVVAETYIVNKLSLLMCQRTLSLAHRLGL